MAEKMGVGQDLAREENQLRLALLAGAVLFGIEALIYVPEVFRGPGVTRPFAINSVAKDVLFAALTAAAAADLARRARLISIVILGHAVIVALLFLAIATGDTSFSFPPPRWLAALVPVTDIASGARAAIWLVGAVGATALLIWLLHRALRARYDLRYLWPAEHATLAGVAEAILSDPLIPPVEIATAADHYWAALDIGYKRRLRLALWVVLLLPLVFLRPPFALMEVSARRRFLERHFAIEVSTRSELGPLRTTVQSAMRFAMQLVYMGYYNDSRTFASTGYVPFSARPNYPGPAAPAPKLRVTPPPSGRRARVHADVVIVGTGAGGSMVAHVLAERGRDVLMLERGRHVRPEEFVEDEAMQYARLYSDGALQLSRDFSFQVLQGMCVGGSTVVNNGVCFDLPSEILERWNGPEFEAGLPGDVLRRSFDEVRSLIGAVPQIGVRGNPIAARMAHSGLREVTANLEHCYGCGNCNIGCSFNRKLSMLTSVLPPTQGQTDERRQRDPGFRGRLELLPDCEVTSISHRAGRATGVTALLRQADGTTSKLTVDAQMVVLSAGAIHSSRVLMASGIGGSLVGQGLAANLGSHMTGYWADGEPLNAFDGLQMSHSLEGGAATAYKIETWFNPVMSQSLVMPGWLGDHQRNMRRYTRLGCLGVITGSTRDASHVMRNRDLLSGAEIDFTPSIADLETLLGGLRHAGQLMLDAGAECVMPATFVYHELRTPEELEALRITGLVHDASDISVNTGHPQGGNPISRDAQRGVLDDTCRVHGFENLLVCDASVFPTAITVNPQLTVMALAHYAASEHIGMS